MESSDVLMFEPSRNKNSFASFSRQNSSQRSPLMASGSSNWSPAKDEETDDQMAGSSAPPQVHTGWDLSKAGMDCDSLTPGSQYRSLEDVCEQTKARMAAVNHGSLPSIYPSSGDSMASSTSATSFETSGGEDETELSFDSNQEYFPMTPAKTGGYSSSAFSHRQPSSATSEHFSPLTNAPPGYGDNSKPRNQSIDCSPRSGLRSMIYGESPADERLSTPVPESPQSGTIRKNSLGQSLNRSLKNKTTHSSPLSAVSNLSNVSEHGSAASSSLASSATFKQPPSSSLSTRRKLPPLAIHGALSDCSLGMPQTPGGTVFSGARDGAANLGRAPVSPFQPPTPLAAASMQQAQAQLQPLAQPPTARKPAGFPMASPVVRTQQMQRQGSLGPMSPLSREFANVSMRTASPTQINTSQASSTSQESSWSTSTAVTTPPRSPMGVSKPLPSKGEIAPTLSRESSGESSGSSRRDKKRSKEIVTSTLREENSVGAARPKLLKSKSSNRVAPYPTAKDSLLVSPQSSRGKADLGTSPSMLSSSNFAATVMEKSLSAPQQPSLSEAKTVSAKHLASRKLHPAFVSNYTITDELGSGGFGFVVGAHRNVDGMPVAVKFIWKEKVPSHGWVRDPSLGVIPLEAFVLRVVDHPCVVKFIELFDDEEFFYLVMEMHGTPWKAPEDLAQESVAPATKPAAPSPASVTASPKVAIYAPDSSNPSESFGLSASPVNSEFDTSSSSLASTGGSVSPSGRKSSTSSLAPPPRPAPLERRTSRDLFECIEQHSRFPEDRAAWVFAQIVEAVFFLDKLGICHRDIKDENCVIDSDWNVKLIDFGSAVISDPRKPAPYFNRFFGTMTFASAEILHGQQYRAPHAEVWSLGVLLSILLSGECPFSDPHAAKRGRISSRVRSTWSAEALDLLCGCVQVDPDRRATISQVRDHPWVRRAWSDRGLQRPSAPQIF